MVESSLLRFLIELRKRLIVCVSVVGVIFAGLLYFANTLYTLLALPLLKHLPSGHGLIATNLVAPFFVPVEFALIVSIFIAVPIFLYQLWGFIAPALYQHERRFIWPLLFSSLLLFYAGVAFAYFIIFPIIFRFLTQTVPQGVLISPDISQYLDFTMKLFFLFGAIFEVPIIIILLVWSGVTSREKLLAFRPYAIVSSFVIAMLIGPPDVLSQILLALPMWFLYEAGVLCAKFLTNWRSEGSARQE